MPICSEEIAMSDLADSIEETLGPGDSIEEGERIAVSQLTGSVYRVTRWIEGSDPEQLRALSKEELSEEQIEELPDAVRGWIADRREIHE